MAEGMELIVDLMQGKLPERVPVFCNLLDQGAKEMGLSIPEYYSNGENVAEAQWRMREKYGYDNLWGVHYIARDAEILGSKKTIFSESGPPNVGHMIIRNSDDIAGFKVPDNLWDIPAFQEEAKTVRLLKERANGRYPVCASAVSSLTLPSLLMGMEKWFEMLFIGPEDAKRELLIKCSEYCSKKITALREAGADLIAYSNPVSTSTFIQPSSFEEIALEWIKMDVANTGTEGLVYFCAGGELNPTLDKLVELSGFKAFYINPKDSVAEAKAIIGERGLLIAPVNDIKLIDWTEQEVEAEVERIMSDGKTEGGFVFGTLVMPFNIPEKNIRQLVKSAKKHGRYADDAPKAAPSANSQCDSLLIGCGIFRKEIEYLIEKNNWPVDACFLASSLHIDFDKLEKSLSSVLKKNEGRKKAVVYGTCHPCMDSIIQCGSACRVHGQNCVEMLLGHDAFTKELSSGAFFLMEDWAEKWTLISSKAFGDNREVIREILNGEHNFFLGVRTPCSNDFTERAEEICREIGLPLRWIDCDLSHLETRLTELLKETGII